MLRAGRVGGIGGENCHPHGGMGQEEGAGGAPGDL